ncbi:MAG: RsmE family RNA methyltransferase [Candidatus Gastranaerophilales bacterium]|nr:RsmE family RNA methyltransferase [Candidatus Gastranaerophilales bacterium]
MPQFLIKTQNIKENTIEISDKADLKHLSEVLRNKTGDAITFIDENEIIYKTEIISISKQNLVAKILHSEKSIRSLNTDITLIQSVIKSSAQDYTVQKATEMGVNTIIPIITKHTVIKFENEKDKAKKLERWQKIAQESCKQCERAKAPAIEQIQTLNSLDLSTFGIKIACVERSAKMNLKECLRQTPYKIGQKIAVFIGPEGGWSDEELTFFEKNDIAQVSLGNLILRAETAPISAIAGIIYEYE